MPFAAFLLSMVGPLVARILLSLGFAVVTFVGMDLVVNELISRAQTAYGSMPAMMLQLAGLAGIGQALSIITGAVLTKVAILAMQKSTRIMSANP